MTSSPEPDRRAPQVVLADDDVLLREGIALAVLAFLDTN
jgi:hypothetical protein